MNGLETLLERERTARARVEEILARFSLILESASVGIWEHDPRAGTVWLSEPLLELLGFDAGSAEADPDFPSRFLSVSTEEPKGIHADDLAAIAEARQNILLGTTDSAQLEYRARHRDGRWIRMEARALLVRDAAGAPEKWTGLCLDISEAHAMRSRAHEAELALLAANARLKDAQLRAIRQQLQPHFLFNALNSIASLAYEGESRRAEQAILLLANLLRQSLRDDFKSKITLKTEVGIVRDYLRIEEVRFPDEIIFHVDLPKALEDAMIPAFLLQPIAENSIKYGRRRAGEILNIHLSAARAGKRVELSIRDDGRGAAIPQASTGIGHSMTRERLASEYGDNFEFEAGPLPNGGYNSRISFPL